MTPAAPYHARFTTLSTVDNGFWKVLSLKNIQLILNQNQGLTSFGSPHCGSRVPGAYTNVSKYAFWIVKEIFEHEFPQ